MPADLVAPAYLQQRNRRLTAYIMIPLMIVALFVLSLFSSAIGARINAFQARFNPQTDENAQASIPGQAGFTFFEDTRTPLDTRTATPSDLPLITGCPLPEGWMIYVVNPTDSLFRLSVIYSVSVSQLQQANCMGDETVILPGQILYVPFVPTKTPSSSPTVTIIIPSNTIPVPAREPAAASTPVPVRNDNPSPTDTSIPPTNTSAPPTDPPLPPTNTAVPPTNTSVPPTNPPPPPTNTSVPPTNPPPPPTNTAVPPTNTPEPPPAPTEEPPKEKIKPTKKPKDNDVGPEFVPTSSKPPEPPGQKDKDDKDDKDKGDKGDKGKDDKDKGKDDKDKDKGKDKGKDNDDKDKGKNKGKDK
jgi:hypothetical protein